MGFFKKMKRKPARFNQIMLRALYPLLPREMKRNINRIASRRSERFGRSAT
jgi:hypothetical protein